jgi:hypothetical protein
VRQVYQKEEGKSRKTPIITDSNQAHLVEMSDWIFQEELYTFPIILSNIDHREDSTLYPKTLSIPFS